MLNLSNMWPIAGGLTQCYKTDTMLEGRIIKNNGFSGIPFLQRNLFVETVLTVISI